jgi:hypothetical protein
MPRFSLSSSHGASFLSHRILPFLALLLCVIAIVALRGLTFDEPLERDHAIYAVAAHEMLAGRPLYSDIWDIKPPAIYLTYALAELALGYGHTAIFLLGVGAATATLFGIYSVVKAFSGDSLAALWAAFFWVLVSSDMKLQANQPNTEVFINLFLVGGLAFLAHAYRTTAPNRCQRLLWSAGCCWAMAVWFKQVAFLVPLFFAIRVWWRPPHTLNKPPTSARTRFFSAAGLWMPSVTLWALTFAYFCATDRYSVFIFTLVDYGRQYAREGASIMFTGVSLWRRMLPQELFFLLPLLLLLMMGLRARQPLPRVWGALLLYFLAVQGAIALPGQYLTHYYQLWLPVAVIGGGLGWAQWRKEATPRAAAKKATVVTLAPGVAALVLLATQWSNWNLPLAEFSHQKYDNDYFALLPDTSRALDKMLLPRETFYQMGYDAGLYFQTRRRPPVGVLSLGSPYLTPLPTWFQNRIIADLEREKPELAVVDSAFPRTPVTRYLQEHYAMLPLRAGPPQLLFMARRDGALMRRLAARTR